jgi:hypothetical protein
MIKYRVERIYFAIRIRLSEISFKKEKPLSPEERRQEILDLIHALGDSPHISGLEALKRIKKQLEAKSIEIEKKNQK